MAKRRKQGHYCRICGEYKANEKFSGKGHAQHICKSCMSNMRKEDKVKDDSGLFTEDSVEEWDGTLEEDLYKSAYDPYNKDIGTILQTEPEHRKYSKLNKDEKSALKELWIEIVTQYWREDHQIPFGE